MKKTKIYFNKIKRNIISIFLILFTICLALFSSSNLQSAKYGLDLWAKSVIPALFPFFIATELLSYTNIIPFLGKYLNKFMRPIFNVPGEGAFAFIMGIISGYPVGAKIVTNLREQGICTKYEAERLITFTNNSGPLFILGTVGVSFFKDTSTGIILFITHLLSCLTVGLIFRFWKSSKTKHNIYNSAVHSEYERKEKQLIQLSNLGEILTISIKNAISTILMIGGFVILFSVVISILNNSHCLSILSYLITPILNLLNLPNNFANGIVSGIFELTNGVGIISGITQKNISLNIIVSAFLLGFGGFSVLLQVWGIISKTDISIFPYFIAKIMQGTIAAFYTYLILSNFRFLSLDFIPMLFNIKFIIIPIFIILCVLLYNLLLNKIRAKET